MKETKMNQEIHQEPEKLAACFSCNLQLVRSFAEMIKAFAPTAVVIAARGTSLNAGLFGKYIIETLLGIPVSIASPSVLTRYSGNLRFSRMLVIGISQSGAAEDVCALIDRGNETGAVTLAITNTEGSLLARHAKYHFSCCAGTEESLAATKTFVTQMQILGLLTAHWAGIEELVEDLRNLPEVIRQILNLQPQIHDLVRKWRFISECFILARGLCLPVALECEIKIQETSFIHSQAFSTADFTHGPVAMINGRAPVLAIACDANTDDNVVQMIRRVQQESAEVLIVTNKPEIAALGGENVLLLPECCEGITGAFAAATVIQLLSCELSVMRGCNPDAPRGLKKVTVTR